MSVIHPKKHPQSILGFLGEFFQGRKRSVARPHGFSNGITEWNYDEFLQEAQAFHVIGQRNFLENHLGVRQALPCAAISSIRESDGAEVFWLFQRTDQIGESKLIGMTACFWGGHVDGVDAVFDEKSRLDLESTLTVGRDREQGEEYRIYRVDSPHAKDWSVKFPLVPANLFIANSTVDVDKYHVAIIYNIKLPAGYAVKVLEKELIGIDTPMSAQEALDAHEAGEIKLESWAQIYFRHVRAQELLDSGAVVATEPMVESFKYRVLSVAGDTLMEGEASGIPITRENLDAIPLATALEVSDVLDWDHGPWYEEYVARGGKNWTEFKRKVIYMFGADVRVWETPESANATEVFPKVAGYYPFFFRSSSGEHTLGQVLTLVELMDMEKFKDLVLVHCDFTDDMQRVGEPYKLVDGKRVPVPADPKYAPERTVIGLSMGHIPPEDAASYCHDLVTGRGGERLDNQLVLVLDEFAGNEGEFVDSVLVWPRDVKANGEVVTTAPSRFDVPLTLGAIDLRPDSEAHLHHAKASIKRVYFQLIDAEGITEVIAVDIERAVNTHDMLTDEEQKTEYPALCFSHPVLFTADTVQYLGQESHILKTILGDDFTSVAFNFEITGRVKKDTNQLVLTKEGPHMVGFNHRNGRSYLDGAPLPSGILEAATGILYLKVDLIGADLVFDLV